MNGKLFCSIYRSARRADMYLYVERGKGLTALPEALRGQFGKPVHVADMILSEDRPLARADATKVMAQVRDQGFYLQMPPPPEPDLWLAAGHPRKPRGA
ncbi:YcgL domain-containing protein [Alloalcanivorax mobilis]|uniref:YcgL domain-containing protein n=1 Tax=Alloalcanivorax mobilis TaxID=2019569 RepID=UPI000B5B425E|nr:YcgL domain-containing protein [Alloalcanivorax mobilis]ASK34491.1 hypothetical protein CEK62_08885 [Alcanivorax sp. N3-2A]|tara:strand:- start:2612 stop:2908 length:297 start_codon:yes stop_codon:yes gene_type:complete